MGIIDTLFPPIDEPTVFQSVMTEHRANGVPTSSWVSLINVGLSLTHFVSEAFSTAATLGRTLVRGMFTDTLLFDAQNAPNAQTLATVTTYADQFAQSQYQESLQPATFTILRVELFSTSNAPTFSFTAGSVLVGTPAVSNALLYTLTENVVLAAGGRVIGYCKAQSPGSQYNLAANSTFELKTTFAGVSAKLPASGERYTFGTGNSSLSVHAGVNLLATFTTGGGAQIKLGFRVQAANVTVLTITVGIGSDIWVNMRSDGASNPISTAAECRTGLLFFGFSDDVFAGVQLPDGTDGSGVMVPVALTGLPQASTALQVAGQNTEQAVNLIPRCISKWDATEVGSGTDDALYYWATLPPTGYTASPVSQCSVLTITKPDGTIAGGYTTVLVSGPLGPLSGADLTAVQGNMVNPRKNAAFTILNVVNTVARNITVSATVTYLRSSKLVDDDITSAIAASLLVLQGLLSMGVQSINPSRISGFIVDASTAITIVALSAPAAPVALAWNERAVFVIGTLTYLYA